MKPEIREQFFKLLDENNDIVKSQFKGINAQLHDKFKQATGIDLTYSQIAHFIYNYRKEHKVPVERSKTNKTALCKRIEELEAKVNQLEEHILLQHLVKVPVENKLNN